MTDMTDPPYRSRQPRDPVQSNARDSEAGTHSDKSQRRSSTGATDFAQAFPGQDPGFSVCFDTDYYQRLGLTATATPTEIRHAYRDLSKRYHPDTTTLPLSEANQRFQQVREAYAILGDPRQREHYDHHRRMAELRSRYQNLPPLPQELPPLPDSSYLDGVDRELSSGEVFSLFLLGVTLVGCLGLAVTIALVRGEPWS